VTTVPSTATLTIDTTSDIADGSYNIEIEATDATTSTARDG
jgi:hypothetical protein